MTGKQFIVLLRTIYIIRKRLIDSGMSQQKMVSHNGPRISDHGGMGSGGGGMNYTGGSPKFYSPGGPGRGGHR